MMIDEKCVTKDPVWLENRLEFFEADLKMSYNVLAYMKHLHRIRLLSRTTYTDIEQAIKYRQNDLKSEIIRTKNG